MSIERAAAELKELRGPAPAWYHDEVVAILRRHTASEVAAAEAAYEDAANIAEMYGSQECCDQTANSIAAAIRASKPPEGVKHDESELMDLLNNIKDVLRLQTDKKNVLKFYSYNPFARAISWIDKFLTRKPTKPPETEGIKYDGEALAKAYAESQGKPTEAKGEPVVPYQPDCVKQGVCIATPTEADDAPVQCRATTGEGLCCRFQAGHVGDHQTTHGMDFCTPVQPVDAKDAEIERLTIAYRKSKEEIEQDLGKALGYPAYDESVMEVPDGSVCIGENCAESLAAEAARTIRELRDGKAALLDKLDVLQKSLQEIADRANESAARTPIGSGIRAASRAKATASGFAADALGRLIEEAREER